jgi:hypothetical protein
MLPISPAATAGLAVAGGLAGTAGMTLLLEAIHRARWVNADMVTAVGSIFTREESSGRCLGWWVHFGAGVLLAVPYILAMAYFQVRRPLDCAGLGALAGAFHGIIVGLMLVVLVAEHHPVPRFRQAGFAVAGVHFFAHLVYGTLVGAVVGAVGY